MTQSSSLYRTNRLMICPLTLNRVNCHTQCRNTLTKLISDPNFCFVLGFCFFQIAHLFLQANSIRAHVVAIFHRKTCISFFFKIRKMCQKSTNDPSAVPLFTLVVQASKRCEQDTGIKTARAGKSCVKLVATAD